MDAKIGYEFSKSSSIYVQGYHFGAAGVKSRSGVRVKFSQNLFSRIHRRGTPKDTRMQHIDTVHDSLGIEETWLVKILR